MKKAKKKKIIYIILAIIILEAAVSVGLNYELQIGRVDGKFVVRNVKSKESIKERIDEEFQSDTIVKIAGRSPDNWNVIKVILAVDLLIILFGFFVYKNVKLIPTKIQIIAEDLYTFFRTIVTDTIGEEKVHFTPYIATIFIFIELCNIIGLIPIPGNMEPTRNLNVTLGLGTMAIVLVHFFAIKEKGLFPYLKEFAEPVFLIAPINIISEFGNLISISFRLFGNILGGAIIILVISNLTRYILLPVGLNMFFGIFIGTIQAFVFTMLVLSYTAVAIK